MSIGLGYALDGARRGQERRRAIDIEDENRRIAEEDRQRRIRNEEEDRSIDVPVRRSDAETRIAGNEARKQLLPGETENAMKKQQVNSGELDNSLNTMEDRHALESSKRALETDQVAAQRSALPDKTKLDKLQTEQAIGKAEFDLEHQSDRLMRQEEVDQMKFDTLQMEHEIVQILQGPKTAEAESKVAETQHKIYGNIYTIAKSDPRAAAQMVNDVKSNGIDNAAKIVFEDGKMRIVDADGNTLSDPKYGPAEFDTDQLEAAFGAKPEKGTYTVNSDGIKLNTKTGATEVITDENGNPIGNKTGEGAKLSRQIQNDIWKRAGDSFGAKLGDDFTFTGEGAEYATEAQTRAFQYYKQAGDGDLTKAWQRAFEEVQAYKLRSEFKNKLSGVGGAISNVEPERIAADVSKFFVGTDSNPAEMSEFMTQHGVESLDDRVEVLKQLGFKVKDYNGRPVASYNGAAIVIK